MHQIKVLFLFCLWFGVVFPVFSQEHRVLFISVDGNYNTAADMFYQDLVDTGAIVTQVSLGSGTAGNAASLLATSTYEQIWLVDFSSFSNTYNADWQAIAGWYLDGMGIILDSRILSSFQLRPGYPFDALEGQNITENYYTNLKYNGGGLFLGTDQDVFQGGINSVNMGIGINSFYGYSSETIANTSTSQNLPLLTIPNDLGTQLMSHMTPGFAPYNVQPNGDILYPMANMSSIGQVVISTNILLADPQITITSPVNNSEIWSNSIVSLETQKNTNTVFEYVWSSDIDGLLGSGKNLQLPGYTFSIGTHTISVDTIDGYGRTYNDTIQLIVVPTPEIIYADSFETNI